MSASRRASASRTASSSTSISASATGSAASSRRSPTTRSPSALGLDEDTAAFIGPDETLEVEGSGGVTVADASKVSFSSVDSATEGQPICILGLVVHVLTAGASFNLHTRQATMGNLAPSRE